MSFECSKNGDTQALVKRRFECTAFRISKSKISAGFTAGNFFIVLLQLPRLSERLESDTQLPRKIVTPRIEPWVDGIVDRHANH